MLDGLRKAFRYLDSNGDGILEIEEMKRRFTYTDYASLTKHTVGDEFWPELLNEFDTSTGASLTYDRFK